MPHQVDGVLLHTMSGTELSRVRTELKRWRIVAAIPPHPVQANPQSPPQRDFGDAFMPTHSQVHVPASPVWMDSCCRLRCFHQQEAQQRIALLADVSQSLLVGTGIFARNHTHVVADLLATGK